MITRNLNFSEGLVNGQKVILRGILPNSRVICVELLDANQNVVLIPRISFHAKVGRKGITFNRVQFPLRIAYSLTINKSQGQTLSRVGLDLRSDCFAHGQLYVALSRAQCRKSVMVLVPPNHIMNSIPHTANIVYPPLVHAAVGPAAKTSVSVPPRPPNIPPTNTWTVVNETGDGACGFRAISRHIHHDPNKHLQTRLEIIQYMRENRQDPNLQNSITAGINTEQLHILGQPPTTYTSYDDYLRIMSNPHAYLIQIHLSFNSFTIHLPGTTTPCNLHPLLPSSAPPLFNRYRPTNSSPHTCPIRQGHPPHDFQNEPCEVEPSRLGTTTRLCFQISDQDSVTT